MTTPVISVFIASYNHAQFLPETLESVLSQEGPGFEVVVVDDGSTDDSREILERYARRDSRIRWSQHEGGRNLGVSRTSNRAIGLCRGEFLAWLGSDDLLMPGSLATRLRELSKASNAGMAYGRALLMDSSPERTRAIGGDVNRLGPPVVRLALSNCIPASTVMLRRSALETVGSFAEELTSSDWELWLRLLSNRAVVFIREPLACHRIHESNLNALLDRAGSSAQCAVALDEAAKRAPKTGGAIATVDVLNLLDLQRSYHWFAAGDESRARSALEAVCERSGPAGRGTEYFDLWVRHLASTASATEYIGWVDSGRTAARWPPVLDRRVERLRKSLPTLMAAWRHHRKGSYSEARRLFFRAACRRPSFLKDAKVRRFAAEYLLRATGLAPERLR